MSAILLRFLIGGLVVSVFAVISDIVKPKSFAGLFGAAPSVALATIGLTSRYAWNSLRLTRSALDDSGRHRILFLHDVRDQTSASSQD